MPFLFAAPGNLDAALGQDHMGARIKRVYKVAEETVI